MIEKMLSNMIPALIPLAVAKVRSLRLVDKQTLAGFAADLCMAFALEERDEFDRALEKVGTVIPPTTLNQFVEALWADENQSQ